MARILIGKIKGADGITPHIGDNGNWFIGSTDTGVNSSGDAGFQRLEKDSNGRCYLLSNDKTHMVRVVGKQFGENVDEIEVTVTFEDLEGVSHTYLGSISFKDWQSSTLVAEWVKIKITGLAYYPTESELSVQYNANGFPYTERVSLLYSGYEEKVNKVTSARFTFKSSSDMEVIQVEPFAEAVTSMVDTALSAQYASKASEADTATTATKSDGTKSVDLKYTHNTGHLPIDGQGLFQIVVNAKINNATKMIPFTVFIPNHWDGSTLGSNVIAVHNDSQWCRAFIVLENYDIAYMRYYVEISELSTKVEVGDNLEIVSISRILLNS